MQYGRLGHAVRVSPVVFVVVALALVAAAVPATADGAGVTVTAEGDEEVGEVIAQLELPALMIKTAAASDTCPISTDGSGRYWYANNQTVEFADLEADNGCPADVVQAVIAEAKIRHHPMGVGDVHDTSDRDRQPDLAYAQTDQTVAFWNWGEPAWYGNGSSLHYCWNLGYVDSAGDIIWHQFRASTVHGSGDDWDTADDWAPGRCV